MALAYGTVSLTLHNWIADLAGRVDGTLLFTPGARRLILPDGTVETLSDAIGILVNGELLTPLGQPLRLAATDQTANPEAGSWNWSVSFRLTYKGSRVSVPGFSFDVPTNGDVNLGLVAPVPSASGTWYIVGPGIPPGGSTGQVLAKASSADYDTHWIAGGGGGGGAGFQYDQTTPLATWTITTAFGRLPVVVIYDATGEIIEADVESTPTQTVITFPHPVAGSAVLT